MKMKKPVFTDNEDAVLYARLCDCREACEKRGAPVFSGFMDPVRAEKFRALFGREIEARAWGGYESAERKMLGFFPEGGVNGEGAEFFPIDLLQVSFNRRFNSPPSHRDYLGSVLGLGLERAKTGDICLNENGALLYASRDVAGFVTENLERVGRTPVKVTRADVPPHTAAEAGRELRITVASLRLDAVIAGAFRLSRGKAAALIEGERVFINWTAALKPARLLADGDTVTVRGLGRVRIDASAGRTKKDRAVLLVTVKC